MLMAPKRIKKTGPTSEVALRARDDADHAGRGVDDDRVREEGSEGEHRVADEQGGQEAEEEGDAQEEDEEEEDEEEEEPRPPAATRDDADGEDAWDMIAMSRSSGRKSKRRLADDDDVADRNVHKLGPRPSLSPSPTPPKPAAVKSAPPVRMKEEVKEEVFETLPPAKSAPVRAVQSDAAQKPPRAKSAAHARHEVGVQSKPRASQPGAEPALPARAGMEVPEALPPAAFDGVQSKPRAQQQPRAESAPPAHMPEALPPAAFDGVLRKRRQPRAKSAPPARPGEVPEALPPAAAASYGVQSKPRAQQQPRAKSASPERPGDGVQSDGDDDSDDRPLLLRTPMCRPRPCASPPPPPEGSWRGGDAATRAAVTPTGRATPKLRGSVGKMPAPSKLSARRDKDTGWIEHSQPEP